MFDSSFQGPTSKFFFLRVKEEVVVSPRNIKKEDPSFGGCGGGVCFLLQHKNRCAVLTAVNYSTCKLLRRKKKS